MQFLSFEKQTVSGLFRFESEYYACWEGKRRFPPPPAFQEQILLLYYQGMTQGHCTHSPTIPLIYLSGCSLVIP